MLVSELDYELPEDLIAQSPAKPRDASRLMVVDVGRDTITHHTFRDLPNLLRHGDPLYDPERDEGDPRPSQGPKAYRRGNRATLPQGTWGRIWTVLGKYWRDRANVYGLVSRSLRAGSG